MEFTSFEAKISELDKILSYLKEQMKHCGVSEKAAMQFEVALEEAVVNVIHYAYTGQEVGSLDVKAYKDEASGCMEVVIRDHGVPFNPMCYDDSNVPPKDLQNQKIGGLGIHYIKKLVDEIDYDFVDSCNVLKLVKKVS